MSLQEYRYSLPGKQQEQRQQKQPKQGLRWSMNIAASESCSTPVSIPSQSYSGRASAAPQILTQARTTTLTSGDVGMAALSSHLGKGKSTGQSVSSMRLSRQFSTQSGHQHFTPTCSLAASAAKAPRMNIDDASDVKSTAYRFSSADCPKPLSSFSSSSSSATSLPSLSSLSTSSSCSSSSTPPSTSASTSIPVHTSTLAPESRQAPASPAPQTLQCAPLSITHPSSDSCSESSLSSSPISPISSHPPHYRYSPKPAAFRPESPPDHERNHSQRKKHKHHKVREHHTSHSSAPLSPSLNHPTHSSCPSSPHSPQQRSPHHRRHVCSLCCQTDKQEQGRLASEIPSTKGTPSPTNSALVLCSQQTPAGKQLPAVPIDLPFLIHTSRSLTFLPSPSPSSALNISPVECQSLSPTTASPAEALYLASRPIRVSSIESFKRKSSSFFSSLTPSSSASSLSSLSSPAPQAASTPYRPPDYLTAYFAETTRPHRASVPPSQCPAQAPAAPAAPAHPSSRSAAAAPQDRFRPLTVVSTRHPIFHPTSDSTPNSLDSDPSSPGLQHSPPSPSNSSLPDQDKLCFYSRGHTTGSLRQHHRYSTSHTPTGNTYTYSVGSRYHPRRNTASSFLYQPIMSPLKAKHTVLSLVTKEQPTHGPARTTQSTLSGGDWGEPTTIGAEGAAGVSSGQDQQAAHGVEPNSAASGQDPWMVVTGSGSSYASNSATPFSSSGFPPSSNTPLGVREEQLNRLPPLQLLDRHEDSDPVLDLEVAHQIRLELPRKLRNATKWNLVYSSDQHGISMTTLYHRCKGKGPMVLAIKDSADAVFGAYVTEEFKPNLTYYGTGECFLWNVTTLTTSPQPPPSPAFAPSPLPSPSPFQLSSTVTTPIPGRSPSPSPRVSGSSGGRDNSNNNGRGGDRRQDLFMAMNDRLSTTVVPNSSSSNSIGGLRSPSPLTYAPQPHLASSPSSSPTLRPVVSPSSLQSRPASAGRRKKKQKVVQFWKWTGKNDYMILSEPGFIGLGGGDGKFGLWIHSDLERGHSACCATFDNEPLAAACHQPLRLEDPQQQRSSGSAGRMASVDREKAVRGDGSQSDSRSSSPKDDKEEFFCQTVEIWAMVL